MSRTMRALLSLAVALPMSVGASAALAQSPAPYPLDVELPLTEMAGAAVAPDAGITITFGMDTTNPTLSGFGGCNTYNASWQSDGTTLAVGPIAATRASCGTDVDALESRYLGLLQAAASWSLNGTAVEIVTADGSTLVYAGSPAEPAIVGAWRLSTFGGTRVPNGIVATAVFGADGTLTGSGGCNTYSASYTLDGSSLKIGPLAATRLSCADTGEIEPAYLDTLQVATGWSVAGGRLTIEGTTPLVFTNGASAEATLTGQPWALVTMGGQTVDASLGVNATFGDDGTITGFGGCNEYNSTYTVDGSTLAINPVAATRKTCATNVDTTESAFFTALEGAASVAITGTDLVVTTTDGSELAFQVQGGPLPTPGTSAAPTPGTSAAPTTEPTAAPTTEPTAGPTPAASAAPSAAATPAGSAAASPGATATIVGSWKMTELMGTALPAGFLKITLDIAADGTLTGNGGCNAYSATWSLSGTTLTLTDLVTDTGGTCDATTQGLEQSYFSVIPYLDTATVTDGKLVLGSTISGSVTFTFEPAS